MRVRRVDKLNVSYDCLVATNRWQQKDHKTPSVARQKWCCKSLLVLHRHCPAKNLVPCSPFWVLWVFALFPSGHLWPSLISIFVVLAVEFTAFSRVIDCPATFHCTFISYFISLQFEGHLFCYLWSWQVNEMARIFHIYSIDVHKECSQEILLTQEHKPAHFPALGRIYIGRHENTCKYLHSHHN